MNLRLGGATTLCILCLAGQANADPGAQLALQWRATPSCSNEQHVRADILHILERTPGQSREVGARVTLTSRGRDGSWRVELVTTVAGVSHQRSFDAESCAAAESAVSLILAIASNPNAATVDAAAPAPAPAPASGTAARADPAPAPQAAPGSSEELDLAAARREPPPHPRGAQAPAFAIAAGLAGDVGSAPAATPGLAVGLGYRHRSLHLELFGNSWATRGRTAPDDPAGAHFRLLSAALRLGYGWRVGQLEVGPLLGLELLSVHAQGFGGSAANFEESRSLPGVALGGFATFGLNRALSIDIELGGVGWLERPSFVVAEPAPARPSSLYRPAAVGGRAQIAASVHFF